MRQIVYISSLCQNVVADVPAILATARRRNAGQLVTGMLFFDGRRFLHAIEGAAGPVQQTFTRIQGDPRHQSILILSDRGIERREFGVEAMAYRPPAESDLPTIARMAILSAHASPAARDTFDAFMRMRRAA
ncbi:hypothetical protein ASG67_08025 [Sphingomonas sp. Leaf339]|uniref:BLUF domain-containing protein n=1 Tax=Sphingomonas sp. Leaf339 TaxID=1736343 RepID=UPI0006FCDF69|nr:BLUF domain-containing protein [Sphingomonas sp. Leaf339]KQU56013.1 hypothetical protein ASG67_08025 [Sphingomonas sp. Leaf339]